MYLTLKWILRGVSVASLRFFCFVLFFCLSSCKEVKCASVKKRAHIELLQNSVQKSAASLFQHPARFFNWT